MKSSAFLACGALLLLPNVLHAAGVTHSCVNPGGSAGCFATIQAAIDGGASPLQIDVAAGVYGPFLVPRGTSVTVSGAGIGATILDADDGPVAAGITGGRLALRGVTVRNAESGVVAGGGGRVTLEDVEVVACPAKGVVLQDGARLDARGLRVSGAVSGLFVWKGSGARVADSRFTGNTTGVDVDDASVELTDSRVVRNGIGVDAVQSKLVIRRSRIAGNEFRGIDLAYRLTNALISDSSVLNNGNGPLSHGIAGQDVGRLRIERSTIAGNPGIGVVTNPRSMAIVASTIVGNDVGVLVYRRIDRRGKLTIDNSTIASNGVGVRCVEDESCGSFVGTIVADSTISDCEGRITTRGHNLIEDASACNVTPLATDSTGVDPKLGPLTDDGHLTDTRPLLPGSPAIDAVDGRFCRGTDQRGVRRGRPCDAGAYETAPAS